MGGPVLKDKMFGFFAFERQREHTSLSEDPGALEQLSLVTSLGANPAAVIPRPFFENRYNGRLDYHFSDRESAYLSYTSQANNSENDQSDGLGDLTGGNFTINHLQVANLTLNSVLTNSLVNSFTFGFQYWNNVIDSEARVPYITFSSGAWFGTNVNVPQQSYQRKFQFRDNITKRTEIIPSKAELITSSIPAWVDSSHPTQPWKSTLGRIRPTFSLYPMALARQGS